MKFLYHKDAMTGWKPHATELESFQKKILKPVLFAELGYKSIEYAGSKPWQEYTEFLDNKIDFDAQANLYQATFNTFWHKEWFKGFFYGNGIMPAMEDQPPSLLRISLH